MSLTEGEGGLIIGADHFGVGVSVGVGVGVGVDTFSWSLPDVNCQI